MVVFDVISPLFKGYPEIKVKNLQSQWDQLGGGLLYCLFTLQFAPLLFENILRSGVFLTNAT